MAEKFALKRLAGSDLSFFEYHFHNKTYGDYRQKGINLNTDVFVDQFYPQAHALMGTRWPVLISIFGPGSAPLFSPQGNHRRPITYNNGKNWRLNGGTIPDDPAHPNRFQPLAPGDLALLRFRGDPAPAEVDVILIAATIEGPLHSHLDALIPSARRTMVPLTKEQIEDALLDLGLDDNHPLLALETSPELEGAIEDFAQGAQASPLLKKRRSGRRMTPAELAQALENAQRLGAEGEELLHGWLLSEERSGAIKELEWTSQLDAVAAYDFQFKTADGVSVKLDAKATRGEFERVIHISIAEMSEAAVGDGKYKIARISRIDEDGAYLRIAENVSEFARVVLKDLKLPTGVTVDGFSISPMCLDWGAEIEIQWPVEVDE